MEKIMAEIEPVIRRLITEAPPYSRVTLNVVFHDGIPKRIETESAKSILLEK
jgi:hypothetical protein